ncbi:unnamed protein product [Heterobilharzia americana]|nr:unnamed protein product [Heterobilharzia americana]CAH8469337.1 unnamed protein product [Heterobilharzia americana]
MTTTTSEKDEMQQYAVDRTLEAMNMYFSYDQIGEHISKAFSSKYCGNWHCKVGKSFGSFDTFNSEYIFSYFVENLAIILYKDD